MRTVTRSCSRARSAIPPWRPPTSACSRSAASTDSSSRSSTRPIPRRSPACGELEVPVVVLDRAMPEVTVSRVLSNHRAGMRDAVFHLLDLGHRNIALINGIGVRPAIERRAGFEEAFAARGQLPPSWIYEGLFSIEHGSEGDASDPRGGRRDRRDRGRQPTHARGAPCCVGAAPAARRGSLVHRVRRRRHRRPLPARGCHCSPRQRPDGAHRRRVAAGAAA